MKTLRLASTLTLPVDAVTQTLGILAKRRAGKSFTARRLTEQLVQAGQQVAIVDPKGDWWGIRSAADGRSPGLPIVILGGERGDVPLEVHAGEVVAKLVVEEQVSALLDLSLFRKHEVATFMTAFLENLYRLKARETYRTPMMLVIDEADAIAPQRPQKGEERMLGAAEDIVRRGGQRGIGCTLVTQRSAVLNKNVLTQVQVLVALRTIAPQDLDALNAWVDVHGTPAERKTLMESLPALPTGDAWFWSPGWPSVEGIFTRVHVLPIETFDSGATPTGEKRSEPKRLADVDLEALKRQMAATIEKAKADDPRELRKQVADLKQQLARVRPVADRVETKVVERFVLKDGQLARAEKLLERLDQVAEKFSGFEEDLRVTAKEIRDAIAATRRPAPTPATLAPRQIRPAPAAPRPSSLPRRAAADASQNGNLTPRLQGILDRLAWLESIGVPQPERAQLALWVELSPTSGGYFNYLGQLRSGGYIDYPTAGTVALTEQGRAVAAVPDREPSQAEIHESLFRKVGPAKARILSELIDSYPKAITRDELADRVGMSRTSGGFFNYLGALRTLGVLDYPVAGQVVATPILFLEA